MIDKPEYKNVDKIMREKNISAHKLALMTGIQTHTMLKRLRGKTMIKLDEALMIKAALGTDMPIEKLFERR